MKKFLLSLTLVAGVVLADDAPVLDIDKNRVSVSGISAGAYMANQLHIAYSDLFSGAGIIAGGPYNCAGNSILTAMQLCMTNTTQPLPVTEIAADIRTAAAAGTIADTANLADDRVWLFHGTKDSKVSAEVQGAAVSLYAEFIPAEQILSVDDVETEHVFPTRGRGNGCMEMVPPYVGDCDYDAAGQMLGFLYGGLAPPGGEAQTGLLEVVLPGAGEAGLLETAYLFVPPQCLAGDMACPLHLVLHGCAQSAATVGTAFIEQTGYLPWAEANGIVLAYPQVAPSLAAPINPHACWDWWGYTGENYATRSGKQMTVLANWIDSLSQ